MTSDHSVVQRFARIAESHANREAISDSDTAISYAALGQSATRTTGGLVSYGVRPGDRVGLYFDREPSAVAALLGTLRSGAVAVPLLASHPSERLRQIVDDAEIRLVVSESVRAPAARALGMPVLRVDAESAGPLDALSLPWPEARSPALLLYTSGSTGRPKGVLQSHGVLLQKYRRANAVLEVGPGDRMTCFSTFAVGQGVNLILQALLSGATLCPFDVRREGFVRLTHLMAERRLTIYASSATLLRNLMRTLPEQQRFPGLRIVRASGERVLPADVVTAQRVFPEAQVIVSYACTETGPIAMHPTNREETFPDGVMPVGWPLEGMVVQILDEDGREVAPGTEGEIVVQSPALADGYWRDPERTARVFATVPGRAGALRYHTGDLGRLRMDGRLEHLGRKDLRVKIRGFRVEIEEIETVLTQHPDVVRAAVAARHDAEGDLRLVGYVQLAAQSDAIVETLRAQVGLRLPEHMIPSTFVFVDEIPVTDSGKIARQLLPDPPADRPALAARCVLPRTPLEATIAGVWREVLGLETVGVHDAFLSIGGDSLKATLVASRLASRLGVELPLMALFETSTISELAAVVERHGQQGAL